MKTLKTLAVVIALFTAQQSIALTQPIGSVKDTRVQTIAYSDDDVISIHNLIGTTTQILFGEGETISKDKVIVGFKDGWSVEIRDNTLFIKAIATKSVAEEGKSAVVVDPIVKEWDTNMNVVTDRHVYQFDLTVHDGKTRQTAYLVKIVYPEDEAKKARQQEMIAAEKPDLTKTVQPTNLKYSYKVGNKSSDIKPVTVYDDGEFTYFQFAGNAPIPAIFSVDQTKHEAIVNSHIDPKVPGTIVVHQISREFALRQGDAVVGVYNDTYNSGIENRSGSTVEGAKRTMKDEHNDN